MTLLAAFTSIKRYLDAVSATAWSSVSITFPGTSGTTGDRTQSWTIGGARTYRINDLNSFFSQCTLDYRINSGTWTSVSDGGTFSVSSGETVGFRVISYGNGVVNFSVTDASKGALLQNIETVATGFP